MLRIPSDSLAARVVITLAIVLTILTGPVQAQDQAPQRATVMANGDLAARWAPYKIRELIHSTSVTPNWIESGDRFWYEW